MCDYWAVRIGLGHVATDVHGQVQAVGETEEWAVIWGTQIRCLDLTARDLVEERLIVWVDLDIKDASKVVMEWIYRITEANVQLILSTAWHSTS